LGRRLHPGKRKIKKRDRTWVVCIAKGQTFREGTCTFFKEKLLGGRGLATTQVGEKSRQNYGMTLVNGTGRNAGETKFGKRMVR